MIKKILIHGHGRMGKLVENEVMSSNPDVLIKTVDNAQEDYDLDELDAVIDFTSAEGLLELIEQIEEQKPTDLTVVTGSSGWNDQLERVQEVIADSEVRFLYGANFSTSTVLFMQSVIHFLKGIKSASGEDYLDVAIHETHHVHKKDMPSGTAIALGELITSVLDSKTELVLGHRSEPLASHELHIVATRLGSDFGTHEVVISTGNSTIKMEHESGGRDEYAQGAVQALNWLQEQLTGYYTFNDYINSVLNN